MVFRKDGVENKINMNRELSFCLRMHVSKARLPLPSRTLHILQPNKGPLVKRIPSDPYRHPSS
jgi:hypothetical protein